ncbi:NAD dependent epimerase dehydratase family protein [Pyrenophora tritici-repentis]|uniref:NAD dependent epimerase-dehydratase family protein n=2 Tax=Pyrenophora tritici-repentis TaxID=45151 RepID=A0A2W1D747_9PLEO|nr:NAD dependent epimerase/dehydratase family protein [Pyrenophora tritici-repentis Pt-1C-BFP]KAA8625829.1 NAD dependent epimerase/dehydratase family protein [Pyrenophora tritici-repentis]EDU40631.1 NAD dependent epimerase/dehydratase family protein [Pyrenophora tritici-repentis Pt-1C-BFP]KAF7454247.1 NAD dependent epimerase/dehydratase family protein [Pyrenophora tritici-repentis]KAF7577345.1 NAD dependent epimerase-dehydratase family protein [Pyrenophora tritici-repentis]KAG9387993.1 NAD dep
MTKLFITGATGYIGGDALYTIANKYPDLEITALVRNSDKGAKVAAQYPKTRLVYGTLDSTDLLTTEACNADIVLHTADCDHVASATALVAGLSQSGRKTHLIHTSGTGVLSFEDFESSTYGFKRDKVYDDWDHISEVTSLPDVALHRNVDKIILGSNQASAGKIQSAIVCPPCIYGPGRGPGNQRSVQVYDMTKFALKRMKGFVVGNGENIWTQVHVQDLSELYLALVTAALSPDGGKASWNTEGYYFAENGDFCWGDVGRKIGEIAFKNKLINHDGIDNVSKEEADEMRPFGSYLWGTNSRCRSIRANKLLGWTPKQKSIFDLLPDIVDEEAKVLGRIRQHAEEAAEGRILK